ncbi:hypothetical protein [Neobacillus sp. MER 74]|nr:hypothetical protein [Neobacillus sp. MER 74]
MMASSYKVSYNASKGAVVMMTKSAALDLAQYGYSRCRYCARRS